MSLPTFARRSLFVTSTRCYTSVTPKKGTNKVPLILLATGTAGIAAYLYWDSQTPSKPKQTMSPLDPQNFVDFKLKKVIPYNHNTSSFVFELPNNAASLIPVASCLLVKASTPDALVDAKGNPVLRPYTAISPPDTPGELTLLIKGYESGVMSKYIHSLKEGDSVAIKGPIIKFPYKANEFEQVALIGGGSGITPLYQIIHHALSDPSNRTKFTLIYANVSPSDILLRQDLDDLKNKYPKHLDIVYLIDKSVEGWSGSTGYVTKELVKTYVGPKELGDKIKVFVCGPPGQVAAVSGKKDGMKQGELGGILKELGYTEDQVFKF